ncbi:MAG: phosphatase PAP2 family protein, partial [Candidatus Diapherotrites archaeon]
LGNPFLWMVFAALLFWKGEEKKSFVLTTLILFASALSSVIKPLVGRLRPSLEEFRVINFDNEGIYAMPSGHSTIAGSITSYFSKSNFKKDSWLFLMLFFVMLSRVYLGAHYLLDVLIGASLGLAIGRIIKGIEENFPKIEITSKRVLEETGVISFLMLGIGVIMVFRQLWFAAFFFGYFLGAFLLKLLNYDSEKKILIGKMLYGIIGLGVFALLGQIEFLKPEAYFLAGCWITLICPLTYFTLTGQGLIKKEEQKPKWPKTTKNKKIKNK